MKDYKFLQCDDGIYFGRPLKNGGISKDSIKITNEDILLLFKYYMIDYCLRYQTDTLELLKDDKVIIEAQLKSLL